MPKLDPFLSKTISLGRKNTIYTKSPHKYKFIDSPTTDFISVLFVFKLTNRQTTAYFNCSTGFLNGSQDHEDPYIPLFLYPLLLKLHSE